MTVHHRPPLNLTDPDPGLAPIVPAQDTAMDQPIDTPVDQADDLSMPEKDQATEVKPQATDDQTAPDWLGADRPMSERQRRRLMEEQRLAETRAAQAELAADLPPLATSADAPPALATEAFLPTPAVTTPVKEKSGGSAYLIGGTAAALWVGGIASWFAYEFGSGTVDLEPLRLAVYSMIALAPAGLLIMMAHAVRQGSGLAHEARRARDVTQSLVGPTALAAHQTGQVLNTLRSDIDQAALAAERARNDMALLRQVLADETTRLNQAAEMAALSARQVTEKMGIEREQLGVLGTQLDGHALNVVHAVERQSRMVVDASDLAQTQLREAEAALAARAADLAAAATEAQDAARSAAEGLSQQTVRLETAGTGVAEQINAVGDNLSQQRAALVSAAYTLRTDQEDFAAQIESQRAQFTQQLSTTRAAADTLTALTGNAGDSIKSQIEAAATQYRALVELAQREADNYDHATKLALNRFEAVAAESRDILVEETRRALAALQATADDQRAAADAALDQAKIRAERLGEALFDAARQADGAAEARIDDARRIVNQTADMVDLTGERMIERLEETMGRMTAAVAQVETAVAELDTRASALPDQAAARVEQVRQSVEQGLAALNDASRRAAADTEALDASFQERVRRNYEMLSEAVRLAGVVSGDSSMRRREPLLTQREIRAAASLAAEEAAAQRHQEPLQPAPTQQPAPPREPEQHWRPVPSEPVAPPAPEPAPAPAPTPAPAPESAAPQPSLDPLAADELAGRITVAIRRMGVDPNALLPRPRIEEAARALAAHEPTRARQIVRRVAPAAVRSVSRRVMADPTLRADAEAYVRLLARGLAEQARQGDAADIQSRLATDEGRAFMLLDAVLGDLN